MAMALSATLSQHSSLFGLYSSSSSSSFFLKSPRKIPFGKTWIIRGESGNDQPADKDKNVSQTNTKEDSSKPPTLKLPKKPTYSMKKGQIVRVDKDKYLNSINYLSVGHPPYYKGLDYIYEDRGEVLDIRNFETGEYALIAWVGIPTAPAWLPTDMLIKSDALDYERI